MIRAIFWDNDGVLVNTEELYYRATRDVLRQIGMEFTVDQYRQVFLKDNCGPWSMVREKGFDDAAIEQMRAARNNLYANYLQTDDIVIPGVEQVLAEMATHFTMGIVTSSKKDHFDIIHRRIDCLRYIDFVIAHGDYRLAKPDPEPYLMAIRKSGYSAEECLVIEDSERGLRSAKAANLACWIIPGPLTQDSDFSRADKIISSLSEIPQQLLP